MPSKVGLVKVEEKKKEDRKEETPKKSESNGKPETFEVEHANPEIEAIERCCPCECSRHIFGITFIRNSYSQNIGNSIIKNSLGTSKLMGLKNQNIEKEDRKEETPKKSESKGKPETFDVEPTNPETEAIERCCPCVKTYRHKMWFKCIVFLAVFALNSADLVCDPYRY
jgi:hypothetical protein